jgi:GH15 family glucan-1,4-alpha-glucosidase
MYPYGVVGNCQVNALISDRGSVDWFCCPQPDSPPIFGRILDPDGGHFSITSPHIKETKQNYISNTNILETVITEEGGAKFKITDFCPRFQQFGRTFRPTMLMRTVEPIFGSPQIRVSCRPVAGWTKEPVTPVKGSNHLRFDYPGEGNQLRLTSNMSLTYINTDHSFSLQEPLHFVLTWGAPFEEDIKSTFNQFLQQTELYWRNWVKHCNVPPLYQKQVIRSALVLKLHCFEDTGAILASLTTSLPEEIKNVRNWDYRFCWLRDAYFSLTAFQNLGHFEEMEGFVKFLLNIAEISKGEGLHPVYKLDTTLPLPENEHPNWAGFMGSQPVRSGNQAATHVQNDVYGEMVLSLGPMFFDERFCDLRTATNQGLLAGLAMQCHKFLDVPDAGLWEFRNAQRLHTFSTFMSWAGLERFKRVIDIYKYPYHPDTFKSAMEKAEKMIRGAIVDGSVRNSPDDESFDASLALLPVLRFPDQAVNKKTVEGIFSNLGLKEAGKTTGFFYRYIRSDDFGSPSSAFLACSYWMICALAATGDKKKAREVLERTLEAENPLGLLAEHYDPASKMQLGNFPQAYSHVGFINSVFAISPSWNEVL